MPQGLVSLPTLLEALHVFHRKDLERTQAKEINATRTLAGRVIGQLSTLSHRPKIAVGDTRNRELPKAVSKATKDANAGVEKMLTEAQARLASPSMPMSFDLAACSTEASTAEAALKTWEQLLGATSGMS